MAVRVVGPCASGVPAMSASTPAAASTVASTAAGLGGAAMAAAAAKGAAAIVKGEAAAAAVAGSAGDVVGRAVGPCGAGRSSVGAVGGTARMPVSLTYTSIVFLPDRGSCGCNRSPLQAPLHGRIMHRLVHQQKHGVRLNMRSHYCFVTAGAGNGELHPDDFIATA